MLYKGKKKSGQASTAEYAIVLMIAVTAITAMTVYVRRTLQARARDANMRMVDAAKSTIDHTNAIYQKVAYEYEPYYMESESAVLQSQSATQEIADKGFFQETSDSEFFSTGRSVQLPPKVGE